MNKEDFVKFAELWQNVHSVMAGGKVFNETTMMLMFKSLSDYPLRYIEKAIDRHVQASNFAPMPNDIISIINARNKRMSADEAWAMMPKSDFDTVVWTEEMAGAYDIAYDLIVEGDKIGGRMAFKGAYDRLCAEAIANRVPIKWKAAIGYDKSLIAPALEKAVALGRISQEKANKLLPAPMDGGVIGKLLTGKVTELPDNDKNLKERWGQLKQSLDAGRKQLAEKKAQEIEDRNNRRLEFEVHRQKIIDEANIKLQGKLN